MTKRTILIVDDIVDNIRVLLQTLSQEGYKVLVAENGERALNQAKLALPDLILLDVLMPGINGFETCKALKQEETTQNIPVIFMTALNEEVNIEEGFAVGAVDYITKPIRYGELLARVKTHLTNQILHNELEQLNAHLEQKVAERTYELQQALHGLEQLKNKIEQENTYLKQEINKTYSFDKIITQSKKYRSVLEQVAQVAKTNATVLIVGETGTGKELLARGIHENSQRKHQNFIKLNCAALPANLIESELFGHERGAFTGAVDRRIGRFELAHQGSIFLDEIGELPIELQPKLLRVLQEGEFERLGSSKTIKVDARVIAATNRDLTKEIEDGNFREDLFYRLNVFPIHNLPLRDRKEDIQLLVQHFVSEANRKMGKSIEKIPQKVIDTLHAYSWPGNIRELQNIIERAVITTTGKALHLGKWFTGVTSTSVKKQKLVTLEEYEKAYITQVLEYTRWKVNGDDGAAKILGLHPSTLRSRIQKLNIQK
ncbi:DNA-binding response regulator [marine bacterium AO1-C]|nr:DNA-binding response regulator [marine bacterium AO1-C]